MVLSGHQVNMINHWRREKGWECQLCALLFGDFSVTTLIKKRSKKSCRNNWNVFRISGEDMCEISALPSDMIGSLLYLALKIPNTDFLGGGNLSI